MPTLIVSSRFSTDSQILRSSAQELGWETLRLDGWQLPSWFELPDDQVAMFYTAPSAFDVADQISCTLVGCNPQWTVTLPTEFLLRELRQTTLADALSLPGQAFVKHAVSKSFPAAVYDSAGLAKATSKIPPNALVHVGEIVRWTVEYRCFVLNRTIAAISPYRRHGEIIDGHTNLLGATMSEIDAARSYADQVLAASIDCPDAFVLDVGLIEGRGWAVVECNECWASGIYACDPVSVLKTLLQACINSDAMASTDHRWDFRRHYFSACGDQRVT